MRKFLSIGLLPTAFATVIGAGAARADEPLFGYVYTTDVLPKGKAEVEAWSTSREGRSQGRYHLWQGRVELSYGLTNNLQISSYLNFAHADVNGNAPDGATSPPEVFADYAVDPSRPYKKTRFETASGEVIWRISSPYLLYYLGDEVWRANVSLVHWTVGTAGIAVLCGIT